MVPLVTPMVRVIQWLMEPLVGPMEGVLQVLLHLTVLLVMLMVRVLQEVIVMGAGSRVGGQWPVLGRALATPGGGSCRRWWPVCLLVLAVFVVSGVVVAPRQSWCRAPLVTSMVRVLEVMPCIVSLVMLMVRAL